MVSTLLAATLLAAAPDAAFAFANGAGSHLLALGVVEKPARFDGGELTFARFEPRGHELLAGLLLTTKAGTLALRKFPAARDPQATSCWRVDDGCAFEAGLYEVPFVLLAGDRLLPFARWFGAEGENLELLEPRDRQLVPVDSASRYTAPL